MFKLKMSEGQGVMINYFGKILSKNCYKSNNVKCLMGTLFS